MKKKIEAYFDSVRDSFIEDLRRLIAVPSIPGEAQPGMPFGPEVAAALEEALRQASSHGLITRQHEGYVGTVDLNELEPELGILVHVDVVGEGDNWSRPPFGGEVEDGKMYGRGASDDKGPAIAALYAMAAVKSLGVPMKSGVRLILGTDEESGCADTKYYFAKEKPPKHVFSPDGEFPVVNTEKGGLRTSFEGLFAESYQLPRVASASGGYRVNVIPPTAQAVVEGMEPAEVRRYAEAAGLATGASFVCTETADGAVAIAVEGTGGHASLPEQGVNAVTALLHLLAALPCADTEAHRALVGVAGTFPHGDYYGEAAGIRMEDDQSGPLTFNFSVLEYTPSRLYGFFDSRIPLCATEANTMDVLEKKLAAFDVALRRSGFSKPHHTPADSPFIRVLLDCYEQYTGLPGSCKYSCGCTYVHGIEGGVAFGCTMPGVDPRPHGADEFVILEDLFTSAKLFAQVIVDLCGVKDEADYGS